MDKLIAKAMRGMKIMIAIKGMDMPKSCFECKLKTYMDDFYSRTTFVVCALLGTSINAFKRRARNCPLIEIKDDITNG